MISFCRPRRECLLSLIRHAAVYSLVALPLLAVTSPITGFVTPSEAENEVTEKDAFESAKELGTIEAWEAFLNNYPSGFRADLARAYVRKLSNEPAGEAVPQDPASAAAPAGQPPPSVAPVLSHHAAGPGSSNWRSIRYEMDEGNASVSAASVEADGLEFLLYCNNNRKLAAILREKQRGVYPDFDGRIAAGIAAAKGTFGDYENAHIPMLFSGGGNYSVSAAVQQMTGEVSIGYRGEGGGFRPEGRISEDLMSDSTFTLSAPPFSATFQLNNSRATMCSALSACMRPVAGCQRYRSSSGSGSTKKTSGSSRSKVERNAARNCRELGMAYIGGRCQPKTRKERQRARENQNKPCPAGMYRNPYGNCQPNETGG